MGHSKPLKQRMIEGVPLRIIWGPLFVIWALYIVSREERP